jgi:hypothetical protein
MPVVRASSRMPSTISSSLTASIEPPVSRATPRAYTPSAGLPMASDSGDPGGTHRHHLLRTAANADATGEQPRPARRA